MADFSSRLKQLRIKKGISQQELADVINVNKVTISGYERGVRRPAGENAKEIYEKLADYFNVDISYLMGLSDISIQLKNPLNTPNDSKHMTEDMTDLMNFLVAHPEYKPLFSSVRNVKKEDIDYVKSLLDRLTAYADKIKDMSTK